MEEVINKSDGQFKNILDDLVDYSKHASKKDPLIKELSRPTLANKTGASLNSSTYSSAASSSSSSSSSSSDSSNSSSSSSTFSSNSSSPSQSQDGKTIVRDYEKLEVVKMEDLRKKAKILEHRLVPSAFNNGSQKASLSADRSNTSKEKNDINDESIVINNENAVNTKHLSQRTLTSNLAAQKCAPTGTVQNLVQNGGPNVTSASVTTISVANSESWKTISAKRDKKRRKPVEKQILAKEIPGNRGDLTVEELTKFIESGTNSTSNSHNNKNSKSRLQSNGTSNNHSNHHNIVSNNTNSSNTNVVNNTVSSISRKSDGHPMNKSQQVTSKTSINIQSKNSTQLAQQPNQKQNPTAQQISQTQQITNKHQPIQNGVTREPQSLRNSNKISTQHQSKPVSNQAANQPNQSRRIQQTQASTPIVKSTLVQHSQPEKDEQVSANLAVSSEQQVSRIDRPQSAVTFAKHLAVQGDEARCYTFGFFDDENITHEQQSKPSAPLAKTSSTNRKHTNQKLRPKQFEASPKSEEKCYKYNDKINANSFNYEQILKFISNAWENTQAQLSDASRIH